MGQSWRAICKSLAGPRGSTRNTFALSRNSLSWVRLLSRSSRTHYIPHTRLTPTDIRFGGRTVPDLLVPQESSEVPKLDSAIRGGVKMTRRRNRQGSLRIKDGSWCVQWTEGNHRPSHSLGRVKDLTKSAAQKLKREWMRKLNDRRGASRNSHACRRSGRENADGPPGPRERSREHHPLACKR
jgi:hypothetical protein